MTGPGINTQAVGIDSQPVSFRKRRRKPLQGPKTPPIPVPRPATLKRAAAPTQPFYTAACADGNAGAAAPVLKRLKRRCLCPDLERAVPPPTPPAPCLAQVRVAPEAACVSGLPDEPVLQPLGPTQLDQSQAQQAADYLNLLSGLPRLDSVINPRRRPMLPALPSNVSARKTLVLDLDHTLIKSSTAATGRRAKKGRLLEYYVTTDGNETAFQRRPYLTEFLQRVSEMYEVVLFTAGNQGYAEPLVDLLDPTRKLFSHRLYRDACLRVPTWKADGQSCLLMKDLSGLGRDLASTIIIDNTPMVFGYQLDNGIPIQTWHDDCNDCELLNLLPLLELLHAAQDVRPIIAATFALHRVVHDAMDKVPNMFHCTEAAPLPSYNSPTNSSSSTSTHDMCDAEMHDDYNLAVLADLGSSGKGSAMGQWGTHVDHMGLDLLADLATLDGLGCDEDAGLALCGLGSDSGDMPVDLPMPVLCAEREAEARDIASDPQPLAAIPSATAPEDSHTPAIMEDSVPPVASCSTDALPVPACPTLTEHDAHVDPCAGSRPYSAPMHAPQVGTSTGACETQVWAHVSHMTPPPPPLRVSSAPSPGPHVTHVEAPQPQPVPEGLCTPVLLPAQLSPAIASLLSASSPNLPLGTTSPPLGSGMYPPSPIAALISLGSAGRALPPVGMPREGAENLGKPWPATHTEVLDWRLLQSTRMPAGGRKHIPPLSPRSTNVLPLVC